MDHEFDNAAEWEWMSEYTRSLAGVATERNLLTEDDLNRGGVPQNHKYNDYLRTQSGQVATFGQIAKKNKAKKLPTMPLFSSDDQGSSSQKTSTKIYSSTDTATLTAPSEHGGAEEGVEGFHRRDNDGDKMERSGLPPNGYYQLPVKRSPEMEDQFFGKRNKNIFHIADKTNTHISKPQTGDQSILEIWGEQDQVEFAKELLKYLQIHVDKDLQATARRAAPWAKVKAAPTIRKRDNERVKVATVEKTKCFRQPALETKYYKGIGCFSWPAKEFHPSVLGMNYEALDPIRLECECYIIWSPKRSAFRVLGDDPENVSRAVERLYIVFCELAVKNRNGIRMHLVVPPATDRLCSDVSLNKRHSLKDRQLSVKRLAENVGVQCSPVGQPSNKTVKAWPQRRKVLLRANETFLRKAMTQAVKDLFYIRGHAKMRVYFGTLVLFAYRRPRGTRHSLQEFTDMIHSHQTAGEVIRFIGEKDVGVELIKNCDRYTDMFLHVNPHTTEDGKLEPSYAASFDILLQDEAQHHVFVKLEVEFEKVPDSKEYRAGTRRWLEIKKGNDGQREDNFMRRKSLLDIKFLDLDHTLAYQFEVVRGSHRRDTDIYPIFGEFVQRLRLDEVPDLHGQSGSLRRISFTNLPGMTVESVVQKTRHQYWMSKTSYIFEVTKYDYLPTSRVNEIYLEGMATDFRDVKPDTRYGASLYSCHWDSVLSKQINLVVGTVGDWQPDMESFFKNYGVGGFGADKAVAKEAVNSKAANGVKIEVKVEDDIKGEFENPGQEKDGFGQLLDRVDTCVEMIADVIARVKKRNEEEVTTAEEDKK